MSARIELSDAMFGAKETVLVTAGDITVSTFRYGSGIAALRVVSDRCALIILPFKGQQIWRAAFDGVDVTMGSMFEEPVDTQAYLETYGAFFIHCGMTAMGGPSPDDTHPLHGEMPNARFQTAYLLVEDGAVTLGGTYQHRVAFTVHYLATSEVTVRTGVAACDVRLQVENRRTASMDLMYLGHANFRPQDGGELIYSAPYTAGAVRVRTSVPSHISVPDGYMDFINALVDEPSLHHVLRADLAFDPEIVFSIDMAVDGDGWAHAMQRHTDGAADYISYDGRVCPVAGRWICRTDDQQGLGIAFPATAGVEGYLAEKAKGNLVSVPGGGVWEIAMEMGRLRADEAVQMARRIDRIAGR